MIKRLLSGTFLILLSLFTVMFIIYFLPFPVIVTIILALVISYFQVKTRVTASQYIINELEKEIKDYKY